MLKLKLIQQQILNFANSPAVVPVGLPDSVPGLQKDTAHMRFMGLW